MRYFRSIMVFLEFFLLFLLFNPFLFAYISLPFDSYELQRLLQWGVFSLAFVHLVVDAEVRRHAFGFWQSLVSYKKILLSLILILGLISSCTASYPGYALLEVSTFYAMAMTIFLFTGLFCQGKAIFLRRFYVFIVITFAVSCGLSLLMWFYFLTLPVMHGIGDPYTLLASPGYMNRRFYDDVACMVLPILIMLSIRQEQPKFQLNSLIFLMLAYLYTRGIISHSRIYLFEPVALLILFPLFYRRRSLPFLVVQAAAIGVGYALYFLLYQHHGVAPAGFPDRATFLNNRVLLWRIAANLVWHHPLLGVGPLHFNLYAYPIETYAAHPHSAIAVIASEWGLPVLVMVSILAISGLWSSVKRRAFLPIGLMGSLIGGFMMLQVDGLIVMPPGEMMLSLILAWAFACHGQSVTEVTQKVLSPWAELTLLSLFLLSLFTLLWVGLPILMNMNESIMDFMGACKGFCELAPDYWSQGFIQYY